MQAWLDHVREYVDSLQILVAELDAQLEQTRIDGAIQDPSAVQTSTADLQTNLAALEQKVADRDQLLKTADAPAQGITLVQKLRAADQAALADRCDGIAGQIADLHHRSIAIFVCQFHLSNLTTDLVRMMTGGEPPATYGGRQPQSPSRPGGLFNDAA